jgi:pilus assembly protein CpaE
MTPEFMTNPSATVSSDGARVLLVASAAGPLAMLARDFESAAPGWPASSHVGTASQAAVALQAGEIDLAVVELPEVGDAELDLLESTLAAQHGVAVVLVTPQISSEMLLRAMRAGVREVVPAGSRDGELVSAIRRQINRLSGPAATPPRGRILAFMPAKGGSGSSFLAANLGYALSQRGQRVGVIDLNLQFGDMALLVTDRRPSVDVAQVCRDVDRLDGSMLESAMIKAADRLWILAAPETPERAADVRAEAIERVLAVARARFDVVIVDVGRMVDAVAVRALDEADTVYVVIQHTIPTLHAAGRLLTLLGGLGYPAEKLQVVANRVDKNTEIGGAEVRKALGRDAKFQIPNSYVNVVAAINRGEPILTASPKDPVTRCLAEWADALAPQTEKRSGWLRGLFGARG